MIFFSSDSHFFHHNIISYCDRPFSSKEHMNEVMVQRWNESIGPDDTIYYLGDFSLSFMAVEKIMPKLNGIKYLIPGNHDLCHSFNKKSRKPENLLMWKQKYQDHGWIVLPERVDIDLPGIGNIQMCHHPFMENNVGDFVDKYAKWRPQDDGRWLLCGHIHEKWLTKGRQINVGVDVWDFRPVSLTQIVDIINFSL